MADNMESGARNTPLLKLPAEILMQVAFANSENVGNARDVVNLQRSCGKIYHIFKNESVVEKAIEKARYALSKQNHRLPSAEYPCYDCLQSRPARFFGARDYFYLDTYSPEGNLQRVKYRRCVFCKLRDQPHDRRIKLYEEDDTGNWFGWCEKCQKIGWWTDDWRTRLNGPPPDNCRFCGERDRKRLKQEMGDLSAALKKTKAELASVRDIDSPEYQTLKDAVEEGRKQWVQKTAEWQDAFNYSKGRGKPLQQTKHDQKLREPQLQGESLGNAAGNHEVEGSSRKKRRIG